jgi:hypothetical protein
MDEVHSPAFGPRPFDVHLPLELHFDRPAKVKKIDGNKLSSAEKRKDARRFETFFQAIWI